MQVPQGNLSLRPLTYDLPISGQRKNPQSQERPSQKPESSQIIDAEFVDLKQSRSIRRQGLENSRIPEELIATESSPGATSSKEQQELIARFQTADLDTPAPGTYLSIYA